MGTVARRGRTEKGRRAVVPLAGWSETRRREFMPLARWSERRWRELARAFGTGKATAPFREAIGHVAVLYETALAMPKEPSAEEFRDARTKLGEAAEKVAALGLEVGFPRTTETALLRALVGLCFGEITLVSAGGDVIRPPLGPETLRDLATMLKSGAWRYRPGRRGDFALMEFVARLNTLGRAVGGEPLTFSVYPNQSGSDATVTYGGTLLAVVKLLQPALPRVAGSIAEDGESKLGPRLRRARDACCRPEVASIP